MSATVNLTALVETRARMTPGEYAHGKWHYELTGNGLSYTAITPSNEDDASITVAGSDPTAINEGKVIGGCGCCNSPYGRPADAAGIVATHNAADVLIEVARAALRLRAAELSALKARMEARTEGNASALASAEMEERLAADSYDAAIAKVSL